MRVLFDNDTPRGVAAALKDHVVEEARSETTLPRSRASSAQRRLAALPKWKSRSIERGGTGTTDALNRETECTYDTSGNLTAMTRLADTTDAVTTSFTYESRFQQVGA